MSKTDVPDHNKTGHVVFLTGYANSFNVSLTQLQHEVGLEGGIPRPTTHRGILTPK